MIMATPTIIVGTMTAMAAASECSRVLSPDGVQLWSCLVRVASICTRSVETAATGYSRALHLNFSIDILRTMQLFLSQMYMDSSLFRRASL